MSDPIISIITPTTGKKSLSRFINSLDEQPIPYAHILLWDNKREDDFLYPDPKTMKVRLPSEFDFCLNKDSYRYSIVIQGSLVQGMAYGSALRSVGLLAANTPYVTFADDDVWYEKNHLSSLLQSVDKKEWAFCKRKVWKNSENGLQYLGIDNFESVGDSPNRKVPYEMVDNSTMIFTRRFGSSAAVLYRETTSYDDDRLMYAFLKKHAGHPGKTEMATVNQVCPQKLEAMFEQLCTKE